MACVQLKGKKSHAWLGLPGAVTGWTGADAVAGRDNGVVLDVGGGGGELISHPPNMRNDWLAGSLVDAQVGHVTSVKWPGFPGRTAAVDGGELSAEVRGRQKLRA